MEDGFEAIGEQTMSFLKQVFIAIGQHTQLEPCVTQLQHSCLDILKGTVTARGRTLKPKQEFGPTNRIDGVNP